MCVQGVDVQCVLQFTLIHAAGCALHRRTSRVIHRSKLYIIAIVPRFPRGNFFKEKTLRGWKNSDKRKPRAGSQEQADLIKPRGLYEELPRQPYILESERKRDHRRPGTPRPSPSFFLSFGQPKIKTKPVIFEQPGRLLLTLEKSDRRRSSLSLTIRRAQL